MANLDDQVDKLEEMTDPNTVIAVGGVKFTPAKIMIAAGIVSSVLGGLYGAFEVYKDYMDMKDQIQKYVAPDLTEFDKRLELITKEMAATKESVEASNAATKASVDKAVEYTDSIKNDLKADVRRVEGVVDSVERSAKQSQRETDISVKEVQAELRATRKELDITVKELQRSVDDKIKKALENPLANQ